MSFISGIHVKHLLSMFVSSLFIIIHYCLLFFRNKDKQELKISTEKWSLIYDDQNMELKRNWSNILSQCIHEVYLSCPVIFKRHHIKKVNSRKKNSHFLKLEAKCKFEGNCGIIKFCRWQLIRHPSMSYRMSCKIQN